MNSVVDPETLPITGRVDAEGRLVDADPPLAALHLRAGGKKGGAFAIPQIADLARLARQLGIAISRPTIAADGDRDLELWVRAEPAGKDVLLSVSGWTERSFQPLMPGMAGRESDFARAAADWMWETDDSLRVTSLSAGAALAVGRPHSQAVGEQLTRLFRFRESQGGAFPILTALAEHGRFDGQIVESRADTGQRFVLSGVPLIDGMGRFAGFRGAAVKEMAEAHAEPSAVEEADVEPEGVGQAEVASPEMTPAEPVADEIADEPSSSDAPPAEEPEPAPATPQYSGTIQANIPADTGAPIHITASEGPSFSIAPAFVTPVFQPVEPAPESVPEPAPEPALEPALEPETPSLPPAPAAAVIADGDFDKAAAFAGLIESGTFPSALRQESQTAPAAREEKSRASASALASTPFGERLEHALRAPLHHIIANAERLRTQAEGPLRSDYLTYAADISSAGRHLLTLVDDIADLQAIENPEFRLDTELVDLAQIARRAAALLSVRASVRKTTIESPGENDSLPASGDLTRALQVVMNLVSNAIRYSPEGGSVSIGLGRMGDFAALVVTDQGKGIDPAEQERIFGKFERLDPSEPGGTGLGLYISRRLARAMGGDISVESAPGRGARFIFTLPVR